MIGDAIGAVLLIESRLIEAHHRELGRLGQWRQAPGARVVVNELLSLEIATGMGFNARDV
jgi:hypothetical protein